jgi:hypothetical protein
MRRDTTGDMMASVLQARQEGDLIAASQHLEKWVTACRRQTPQMPIIETATGGTSSSSAGLLVASFANKMGARFGRPDRSLGGDVSPSELRLRATGVIKTAGSPSEQVMWAAMVQKHNEHGQTQPRLLVITDQAVYNVEGKKCKRRIPLQQISIVSSSVPTGQCVVHVPSDYDLYFTAASRGYDELGESGGAPLDVLIEVLQRAYMAHAPAGQHLPVRTSSGPLVSLVQKKSGGVGQKKRSGVYDETSGSMQDHNDD